MRSPILGDLARIALVAVAYYAAGRLSVALSLLDVAPVAPVWPPRGIALALLLLLGYRVWPGVTAGAFLAAASSGVPLVTSAGVAMGSTLDVLLGTYLLRRYGFRTSLDRVKDILLLLTLAALLSTMVSATIGVGSMWIGGVAPLAASGQLWVTWWTSDAMGDLLVAPVLLAWATRPRQRVPSSRLAEAAVLLALTIAASQVAFGEWLPPGNYSLAYITMPFVVWAALRFGQRGAATATFVVLSLALWGTTNGTGPFARTPITESLLLLQSFLSVAAVTGLLLAAVLTERARAMEALRQAESKYHGMFEHAVDGIFQSTPEGRVITANAALARMLGYDSPEELIAHITDVARQLYVDPAGRGEFTRALAERGSVQGYTTQLLRRDGTPIWVTVSAREVRDADGALLYYEGTSEDITERKRAEEELARQRAFLRQVIDINPHMIFAKDREGRFLLVNQAVADAYGTTVEKLLGKTDADFASAAEAEAFRRDDTEVMNTGREKAIPVEPLTDAQGRLHWLQTIKRPMAYRDGAFQQVLGVATDMTERVSAEQAVRASEQLYRTLVETMSEGLVVTDMNDIIEFVNDRFCAMLGYPREEVLGRSTLDFVATPADAEILRGKATLRRKGVADRYELRFRSKSGATIWMLVSGAPLTTPTGDVVGMIGVVSDIAELKRAEEALRSSEERYRALYDDTPSMYFTVDPAGTVLSVNHFGANELGYEPEELVGRSVLRVFAEDDQPAATAHVAECVAHPELVFQWELRKVRKNGSLLWVKETARATRDRAGELVVLIVCEDITERKRAEERQVELQASLRRSETMSAMGLLVAGVAHEVRNPLFGISASLDAFEARLGPQPEHARTIAVLRSEVGRLALLMQELLDYGKPVQSEPVPDAVDAVVAEAVDWCAHLARRSQVSVRNETALGLPPVLMDRKRLVQVFENLLQNAIQHSPAHGVVAVTVTREGDGDRDWIVLSVTDSGPGFEPEDLPRVFEPFFTKRRGGTGLGLAIVQRIVEDHGGTIAAANRLEGGAAMVVRLPCVGARQSVRRAGS